MVQINPTAVLPHRQLKDGEFWRQIPAYQGVSDAQFNDHGWQLKNSVTNKRELFETVRDIADNAFLEDAAEGFLRAPMSIRVTPYVIALIDWSAPYRDPLRRQYIPVSTEQISDHPELEMDSLHERANSPVKGLTHRYPDKVLLLALDHCPVYCRYCTRSYAVGGDTGSVEKMKLGQGKDRLESAFEYIASRPEVEDVVISGGDTAMLRPEKIRWIGETLLSLPNICRIRYATKAPAILPQKILSDHEWYQALAGVHRLGRRLHKEVCVHTHFSHPNEVTEISRRAMNRFMEDGITVRNQAVLQRNVNDSPETMSLLTRRLSFINVQPYYVYMHDLVKGVEDLRTTLEVGIDIEKRVRGITAGFNTPAFIVDLPGGGGKRDVHSYEYYSRETGISVFISPSVNGDKRFLYYDPIGALSPDIQRDWLDADRRREMIADALAATGQVRDSAWRNIPAGSGAIISANQRHAGITGPF
jgi:lysine 2,3-aminomutase